MRGTFAIIARDQFDNNRGSFSPNVWATVRPLPSAAAGLGGYANRTRATHPVLLPPEAEGASYRFNRYAATVYAAGEYLVDVATLIEGGLR